MREIDEIILHCSGTKTSQSFTAEDVKRWHISPPRNWSTIGYHFVIELDGKLKEGRSIERIGSHCLGHNTNSIGICFMGGYNPDGSMWEKPTDEQIKTYKKLRKDLFDKFGELLVTGHYQYSSKSCPNFDICLLE